jgi:hypothetical protein
LSQDNDSIMMCLSSSHNSQDDDSMTIAWRCVCRTHFNSHDSQDDDSIISMTMCMSNSHDSQDDDSMTMCRSNSHSDAVIMSLPFLKGVLASQAVKNSDSRW